MHMPSWPATTLALLVIIGVPTAPSALSAQDSRLLALDGTWIFAEDRIEGRTVEQGSAAMGVRFTLRVENDAVMYLRPRGDERIRLDGSVIEKKQDDGSIRRYRGEWKNNDGWLEYTMETLRQGDSEPDLVIKRVFHPTDDGLLVYVFSNKTSKQVALYRYPEDIALPEPARATIADMAWLAGAWTGTTDTSSMEERWSPLKGGAMLGSACTVTADRMVAFKFVRIVERDGGLVYVTQPGGRPPSEFVLTELNQQRAVFVSPRHGYPQRIVYELSNEGVLTTSIDFARGRLQSFAFKRLGN